MASSETQASGGSSGDATANFLAALAGAFGNTSILEHSGDSIIDMYSGSELTAEAIEERTMQGYQFLFSAYRSTENKETCVFMVNIGGLLC